MTANLNVDDVYRRAAGVGCLTHEQKEWLVQHARQRAAALERNGQTLLDPAIVSIAAVLMTPNERLSSLTALSHAEKLTAIPGLGQALIDIQNGLNYLSGTDITGQLAGDSMSRNAMINVLRGLIVTVTDTLRLLGAQS